MTMHRVLITGIGGNIGQGVLKSLRASARSFFTVGIDMEPLSAGFSLVDRYAQMPRTGEGNFKELLKDIIRKEKIEAVYVCSPTELAYFSSIREELEKEFPVTIFVNPPDVIRTGEDKQNTAEFLKRAGFPYAESVPADDLQGVKRLIEAHGFPLFAKPRKGFSSKNVFLVHSEKEINAARVLVPDLIIQEFLPDEEEEYTAGTVSGRDGKVRAVIVLRRHLLQGTTYRTELVEDTQLSEQVARIVEALGATCVCNLQFRLRKGRPVVFEINPRFSGTSGIRYHYGFNEAEMIFDLYRLKHALEQPVLKPSVVLRYWNETCIPGASFSGLRKGEQSHDGVQTILQKPITENRTQFLVSSNESELEFLDSLATKYFTEKSTGPDKIQLGFVSDKVIAHCKGPKVLELGCGAGNWTKKFVQKGFQVTAVEGSSILADKLRKCFGSKAEIAHSLFETFQPSELYDDIVASCVMEHVDDPITFLTRVRSWLKPKGVFHVVVPNALSLHRRVGFKMGMLQDLLELSPQELEVGHRRAYTTDIFRRELESGHLRVQSMEGIFVKPLSSGQMLDWPQSLMEGYNAMSAELSEYAAYLYARCDKS